MLVRSNLKNKNRVALWERHPDHPGGEVKIADERVYEVADTQAIRDALQSGTLTEVQEAIGEEIEMASEPGEAEQIPGFTEPPLPPVKSKRRK